MYKGHLVDALLRVALQAAVLHGLRGAQESVLHLNRDRSRRLLEFLLLGCC